MKKHQVFTFVKSEIVIFYRTFSISFRYSNLLDFINQGYSFGSTFSEKIDFFETNLKRKHFFETFERVFFT